MNLLLVEARRALHRRVVWTLLAVAAIGIVLIGLIAFVSSAGLDIVDLRAKGETHPALMGGWWSPKGDSILVVGAIFLAIGGLLGGASVVGGEWKAGTVATVLAWEPRRVRLHAARLASCALLAWILAIVLQVVMLAALLPAVFAHGSTDGVDGAWAASVAMAMVRIGGVAALTALLGAAIATLGRSTAAALVVAGVWMAVLEAMLRSWRPGLGRWLVGENIVVLVSWKQIDDVVWSQPVAASLGLLLVYAVGLAVLAGAIFRTRDIGGV